MKRAPFSLSIALLLGVWSTNAQAVCFNKDGLSVDPSSNGPAMPWDTEFRQATVVVIGTIFSEERIPDPNEAGFWSGTLYKLRLERLLKGKVGNTVAVFSPNDSGRLPLSKGIRYLLFLHEERGHLTADACGNSAKLVSPFR
jgi:hypothetical protein